MTKEEVLINLEYWISCLENPTYNSLEVGFRHNPLSKDEIIERYKTECEHVHFCMTRVLKDLSSEESSIL